MISRYDQPSPDNCDGVREMFKRIQGFTPTLDDGTIISMMKKALKIRRKFANRIWDDLTGTMYKAEPKIKMPTVWFRFRWLSTGGCSAWFYEDSGYATGNFKRKDLNSEMQERVSEKAMQHERGAHAEWDVIDPPRAIVLGRIEGFKIKKTRLTEQQAAYENALESPNA